MTDTQYQSDEVIAKELTIAVLQKMTTPNPAFSPDKAGDTVGKIYKTVIKNVREAYENK